MWDNRYKENGLSAVVQFIGVKGEGNE